MATAIWRFGFVSRVSKAGDAVSVMGFSFQDIVRSLWIWDCNDSFIWNKNFLQTEGEFGLRWQAKRDTAFARTDGLKLRCVSPHPKAPSPLRSAGAVQEASVS